MTDLLQPRVHPHPGARVRQMRLARGLSLEELTRRVKSCGYQFHSVKLLRIEREEFHMKVSSVAALAEALGVDPAWLAGFRDGDPERQTA